MKYLAIDLGSSFIKSAVLDTDAFAIGGFSSSPTPPRLPNPNPRIHEIDLDAIFGAVRVLIERHASFIDGILLTTQTHGYVLMDGEGTPLTPYVSWQDQRCLDSGKGTGISYLDHLRETIDPRQMNRSGIVLKPGLALSNLYAWLNRNPDALETPGGLQFCTLGSFVIARLTGRNICHLTNAAATGLADIENGTWNRELIDSLGLGRIRFPEILPESVSCGFHEAAGRSLPVYPDVGDHHAAMLGSLMAQSGEVCVNIATAAQMTMISSRITKGLYEVRPFFDGKFLNTITGIPGGRCLDVLMRLILDVGKSVFGLSPERDDVWRRVLELSAEPRPIELVVKTGFFEGTVGVGEGAIGNIGPANLDVGGVFAAAYRNIGETYDGLIERFGGGKQGFRQLVFAGGVSRRNEPLRRAIAEQIGIPGVLSPFSHEVFVGLFRLALVIQGRYRNVEETRTALLPQSGCMRLHIEKEAL